MDQFKTLIAALEAGPTDGPWVQAGLEKRDYHWMREVRCSEGSLAFCGLFPVHQAHKNAAYIAAANPATIRALLNERDALLARLDAAEAALNDAATSLETISRLAGRETYPDGTITCMGSFSEVRGYAISRAAVARAALTKGA